MKTIECRYCDTMISYQQSANFIVLCPKCKRYVFLECEYGYGPVTPCIILLGDEIIGTINVGDRNIYYLGYQSQKIMLKKTYLEALYEAVDLIENLISNKG